MGLSISCPFAACTDLETSLSSIGFQGGDEAKSLIKSISFKSYDSEPDMERKEYEVAIEKGKFFYKERGELIDTMGQTKGAKWIFVLSTTKTLYVGIKKKGFFQHSSFLSGGAALAAGRIVAEKGVLKAVWPHSGEGKEVNLAEKCPRSKLQQQCIKYLGPMERKAYEVAIENGKFFYKEKGELIDTMGQTKGAKWIFVLSTTKTLYVGIKKKGSFQHSSFLSGGAALAAGRIVAEKGVLKFST
ncbi:hypothetical protein R6Q59_024284 [Mikania micrantha]